MTYRIKYVYKISGNNKDSESSSDSEGESMNNDHTNDAVEKEPLESEAHDSLVSKQGEQSKQKLSIFCH